MYTICLECGEIGKGYTVYGILRMFLTLIKRTKIRFVTSNAFFEEKIGLGDNIASPILIIVSLN